MQGFFTPMNLDPAEGNSYASGSLASVIISTHLSTGRLVSPLGGGLCSPRTTAPNGATANQILTDGAQRLSTTNALFWAERLAEP
jgi:hypothetical protein